MSSNVLRRFAAPAAVALVYIFSRLLFVHVSSGTATFSVRGDLLQRVSDAVAGRAFDVNTVDTGMPILDRELLLHDLGRSLWYLHAQPPLFNLFLAGMLRLPGGFARNYQWLNWILGLAFYLLTFGLMRRLNVPPWIAAVATIVFMLLPNAMWLENAVYYGLPLALLLLVATLLYDRALRHGSVAALAGAALLLVAMVLTRAFFTPVWCALLLAFFALTFARRHGRRAQAAAAVALPFLLVLAFQVKQYAVFRQTLGSSWFGCNLFAMTAGMRPEKARALAAGKVSNLVNVYRNAPPEVYLQFARVPPAGVPALDALRKASGDPNFNHQVYMPIGRIYLHDSLYLIAHAPHKYLLNVLNSFYLFCGYQIGVVFQRPSQFFARWKWTEIAAPLIGFPLIVVALVHGWRRVRRDPPNRELIAVMLFNIAYVIAVSCLFEKAETPLYRHQIEAFLWTLLASHVRH